MIVALRLSDEVVADLDGAARAHGLSRSGWIARAIKQALGQGGRCPRKRRARTGSRQAITIRVPTEDVEHIDRSAEAMAMKRSQWIATLIEGRLWDGEGRVIPSPLMQEALGTAINQIVRIGRNVNQAVHAINAAAMPESSFDMERAIGRLVAMHEELKTELRAAEDRLFELAIGEQRYWRGEDLTDDV